jgi:tetratricopeptide (TPR) repeat protein
MKRLISLLIATVTLAGVLRAQTDFECPQPSAVGETSAFYAAQGDVAFSQRNFSRAVLLYTCAIEVNDANPAYFSARGYAYGEIGDVERAVADYTTAVTLDELYVPAYINRASLYTAQGNLGLALGDLSLVLALEPDNLIALNNRAVIHGIERNYDLALADINALLAVDNGYSAAYATRAMVYSAMSAEAYRTFVDLEGENAVLPAGTPDDVLIRLSDSLVTGDFGVWLGVIIPAR